MNSEGDVVNENALNMIQFVGMVAFPFTRGTSILQSLYMRPPGPYAVKSFFTILNTYIHMHIYMHVVLGKIHTAPSNKF
jgi:hypothetical protein